MIMDQQITTQTPRYEIRSLGWDHLDIFDTLEEAMFCTINFAIKFQNVEFFIVKKVNWEEEIVFRFGCNLYCKINDIEGFYKSLKFFSQEKLSEMITWRKSDGN